MKSSWLPVANAPRLLVAARTGLVVGSSSPLTTQDMAEIAQSLAAG